MRASHWSFPNAAGHGRTRRAEGHTAHTKRTTKIGIAMCLSSPNCELTREGHGPQPAARTHAFGRQEVPWQ
jgi:hypothetical protein